MESNWITWFAAAAAVGLIFVLVWRRRTWPQVLWLSGRVSASLDRDDTHLRIGQFLRLCQELPEGTSGWTESKFNLPEDWHVTSVEVLEHCVRVTSNGIGTFEINSENFGRLSYHLLTAQPPDDSVLNGVWRRYALAGR